MYRFLTSTVSVAALFYMHAPALAENPTSTGDWYVSMFAGGSSPRDVLTVYYGTNYAVDFDSGYVLGLTAGRHIGENWRIEAELSYARYKASEYTYGGPGPANPAEGPLSATYLMLNGWRDIAIRPRTEAYFGGGIGIADVTADTYFGGDVFGYGPGETGLALQLGMGVNYQLSDRGSVDFGYRYRQVNGIDFDDSDGSGIYEDGDLKTHSLQIGYRYRF